MGGDAVFELQELAQPRLFMAAEVFHVIKAFSACQSATEGNKQYLIEPMKFVDVFARILDLAKTIKNIQ
jgi:hypothetical protein